MSVSPNPTDSEVPEDPSDRSLVEDVIQLIDDGRTLVEAEVEYQKSRVAYLGTRTRSALVPAVLAGALGILAAMAFTLGMIIALTPLLTGLGATAVVTLTYLVLALILARMAAKRWRAFSLRKIEEEAKP